jgi:flavin-dependent dehydrogenase
VANACLSGEIAGRIIGKATETKDYSKEAMQEYDTEWRKVMEDRLYHSYLAKTKLTEVEPESIDTVVKTMADVGVEEPTVAGILAVLEEHHPEILAEIGDLI